VSRGLRTALVELGLGLGALWLLAHLWGWIWPVAWPFAVGGLGAWALEGPVRWLVARGVGRAAAAAVCLVSGTLAGAGLVGSALWLTVRELGRLRARLPALERSLGLALAELGRRAGDASAALPPGLRAALAQELQRAYLRSEPVLTRLFTGLEHAVAALPDALFACFLAGAAAYFGVRDRERLVAWLDRRWPQQAAAWAPLVAAVGRSAWGMVRAQLVLALATSAVSLVGLLLIGAPYALLASLAAGVLDVLPVVGPAALFVPWSLGCLATGLWPAALGLSAVLLAVAAARWLLTPRLVGGEVGLHPFVALAAMYVGAHVAGLEGLVLGPLVAAAIRGAVPPPRDGGPPAAPRAAPGAAACYNRSGRTRRPERGQGPSEPQAADRRGTARARGVP
jgi:sporulation integral membrane protein YtvI